MGVQSHNDSRVIMGSGRVRQQLMAPAAALSEHGSVGGGGGEMDAATDQTHFDIPPLSWHAPTFCLLSPARTS